MSLKTLQKLLVVSALLWALLPTWGSLAYASAWVVLAVGTRSRVQAARAVIDGSREELGKGLSEETLAWIRRFPFLYTWKDAAKEWGTTWRMAGLLALFLAPWFLIRALFLRETWEFALLAPLAVLLLVGGRISLRLEVTELLKEKKYEPFRPQHEEAVRYLSMRTLAGKWPPVPSPDGPRSPLPPPGFSPPGGGGNGPVLPPPGAVRPPDDAPPKGDKPT
ncbi:MAG: hypothetical protein AB1938_22695 [Myxococcota bacterium]